MNIEQFDDIVDKIQSLTTQMATLAAINEWDKLAEIERQRESLIKVMCAEPVSLENSERMGDFIRDLMERDKQVLEQAIAAKKNIYNETKSLLDSKRAFDGYAKVVRE